MEGERWKNGEREREIGGRDGGWEERGREGGRERGRQRSGD